MSVDSCFTSSMMRGREWLGLILRSKAASTIDPAIDGLLKGGVLLHEKGILGSDRAPKL
jgi:hypothetical protein